MGEIIRFKTMKQSHVKPPPPRWGFYVATGQWASTQRLAQLVWRQLSIRPIKQTAPDAPETVVCYGVRGS